jgi:hypothetical protein
MEFCNWSRRFRIYSSIVLVAQVALLLSFIEVATVMTLNLGGPNSVRDYSTKLSRVRFLSSSAAVFIASTGLALGNNPEECMAVSSQFRDNPRYIDKELQMKYGESPGTKIDGVIPFLRCDENQILF